MSDFPRPAFQDLINSAVADLARLPGADPTLRRSLIQVLAYMSAALASGEYDYIAWILVNALLPDSCTGAYLDRWVAIFGVAPRKGPVAAVGNVVFSGTAATPIPIGTQEQTNNSGVVLQTTAAADIDGGGTVSVAVEAVVGGVDGNLPPGTPVNLLVAIAGVVGTAVVDDSGLSGGTDAETDAQLRVRLLQRTSAPPMGGTAYDYVSWAEAVSGVTRVWVYPLLNGAPTVGITFTMDGRSNIIPLTADLNAVQAYITDPSRAPLIAQPFTFACTPSTVAISIQGLTALAGFTVSQAQASIATALAALSSTITPGGYGWDGDAEAYLTGGLLSLSQIYTAIDTAPGVGTFNLLAPTANQVAASQVLMQLGAPVYS